MSSPKRNVAYTFYIALVDSATSDFKSSPTIAAGDFQVSGDGAAFANLATIPAVDPSGSIGVLISLSAAEMNFDKIMVQCIDAAGAEWDDVLIFIDATTANVDDIVRATTPANTLDINATGEAGLDLDNTSGTITAAQLAADCIGASELASDAANEIRDAILTAVLTEPAQAVPPTTGVATLEDALRYLFFALTNRVDSDTTANFLEFYNRAAAAVQWKKAISDDGAIATEATGETGP